MRSRVALALGAALLVAGCGMFGGGKPASLSDLGKPGAPELVTRCPVPKAYDDDTLKKIEQAIEALPPDSVLRAVMKDYEAERDDLRMCQ
jgi:hypothetical protein